MTVTLKKVEQLLTTEVVHNTGREIDFFFFSDSHLAPKFFKVVANSKKLVAIFKDKQNLSLRCQRSR